MKKLVLFVFLSVSLFAQGVRLGDPGKQVQGVLAPVNGGLGRSSVCAIDELTISNGTTYACIAKTALPVATHASTHIPAGSDTIAASFFDTSETPSLQFVSENTAEAGTTTTNVTITTHGRGVSDLMCNVTRAVCRSIVSITDVDNFTVATIASQTSGDTIRLYNSVYGVISGFILNVAPTSDILANNVPVAPITLQNSGPTTQNFDSLLILRPKSDTIDKGRGLFVDMPESRSDGIYIGNGAGGVGIGQDITDAGVSTGNSFGAAFEVRSATSIGFFIRDTATAINPVLYRGQQQGTTANTSGTFQAILTGNAAHQAFTVNNTGGNTSALAFVSKDSGGITRYQVNAQTGEITSTLANTTIHYLDTLAKYTRSANDGLGFTSVINKSRAGAAVQAGDILGSYSFNGIDSTPTEVNFGQFVATAVDPTAGSHDGRIGINTAVAGVVAEKVRVEVDTKIVSGSFVQQSTANVASAVTMALPVGNLFHITGTTSVTTMDTCDASNSGRQVMLIFDDILTFTDGNNLIIQGDFVTTADDSITLVCDGTNWYELARRIQ